MHLTIPSKSVNSKIRLFIQPIPILNMLISRFCTFKQCKYPMSPIFGIYYPAYILTNIRFY